MRFDREPCPQAVSYSSCPTRTLPRWCLIKWKTKTIFTKSTGFHISWSAPTGYPTVKVHASRLCPSSTWCSGFAPLHRRSNLVLFTSAQINYIQHTGFSRYKNKTVHIQICQLCGHLSKDDQVDGAGERLQKGYSMSVINVNKAVSVCLQSGC